MVDVLGMKGWLFCLSASWHICKCDMHPFVPVSQPTVFLFIDCIVLCPYTAVQQASGEMAVTSQPRRAV
jgi:hypothetical protein